MITVFFMGMIVYSAKSKVDKMCSNDKYYSGYQEPCLLIMPPLFCKQQYKSNAENTEWKIAMMVLFKSMVQ